MSDTEQRKKIAIIGAHGRLGSALVGALSWQHDIVPIPRTRLDFNGRDQLDQTLAPIDFDLLINTAAFTDVDKCEDERDMAFNVNGHAVGAIARHAADRGVRMIHFSTDYVFDGEKTEPYTEDDTPNPISVYGESKLLGEQQLLEASADHLAVRVCWVFGPARPGFPDWIVDQLIKNDSFSVVQDKTGSPTYTIDCSNYLAPLLFGDKATGGILHLANSGAPTWQEWAQQCADSAAKAGAPLKATTVGGVPMDSITAFKAKRPRHSALSLSRYEELTGTTPRPWAEAIDDYFDTHYSAPNSESTEV